MTVPIAVLQWYRLQCYAWYRFSAIVIEGNLLWRLVIEDDAEVVSIEQRRGHAIAGHAF